jgi:hypothetical protein
VRASPRTSGGPEFDDASQGELLAQDPSEIVGGTNASITNNPWQVSF